MVIPTEAIRLDLTEVPLALRLDDGRRVKAQRVVVATGARYRRLNIPNLADFEGRGIWYWASPIEARLCRDEEIVLVGGGNSAGQATVFLRNFAKKSGCWCVGQASQRACRNISSIASARSTTSKY
jgi:thioredoxin reductase (NADPH)